MIMRTFLLLMSFIIIGCDWEPSQIDVIQTQERQRFNLAIDDTVQVVFEGLDLQIESSTDSLVVDVALLGSNQIQLIAREAGQSQIELTYRSEEEAGQGLKALSKVYLEVTVTAGIPVLVELGELSNIDVSSCLNPDACTILDSIHLVLVEGGSDSGLVAYVNNAVDPPSLSVKGLSPGDFALEVITYDINGHQITPLIFEVHVEIPKRVLAELFTNAGCTGCPAANDNLDQLMEAFPTDLMVLRYHVWWPGTDPMFDLTADLVEDRYYYYSPPYIIAPTLIIDGISQGGDVSLDGWTGQVSQHMSEESEIHIWGNPGYDESMDSLFVSYRVHNYGAPYDDVSVWTVLTEDSIYYAGSNGEDNHMQVMRAMDRTRLSPLQGSHTIEHALSKPPDFEIHEKYIMIMFIQNEADRQVLQSRDFSLPELLLIND